MGSDRAAGSRRAAVAGIVAALALALAGCGSGTTLLHRSGSRSSVAVAPGVPAGSVAVITGWADALRAGHVAAASRFFRIPSVFFTGNGPPVELSSLGDVEHANAALPCGAKLISVSPHHGYVDALFRLGNRPGPGGQGGCGSGRGQTARTYFLIRNGHIAQWLRAPDEPGDNGSRGGSPPGSSTQTGPAQTV